MRAIVLAGGLGKRLLPRTASCPKALVRLGGYSILEIILRQLKAAGFDRVTLCVSHLEYMIRQEFSDGRGLGLSLDYRVDVQPLGTAGPLRLVGEWDSSAVVLNADLLTSIDFADLHAFHEQTDAVLTVATKKRDVGVDFGVLHTEMGWVRGIWEKPRVPVDICLGIYVASPQVRHYMEDGEATDMSELIRRLLRHGQEIAAYSVEARWHDIGTPAGFSLASTEFMENMEQYLPASAPQAPRRQRRTANNQILRLDGAEHRPSQLDTEPAVQAPGS